MPAGGSRSELPGHSLFAGKVGFHLLGSRQALSRHASRQAPAASPGAQVTGRVNGRRSAHRPSVTLVTLHRKPGGPRELRKSRKSAAHGAKLMKLMIPDFYVAGVTEGRKLGCSRPGTFARKKAGLPVERREPGEAGGAEGNRTPDLCSAIAALSHLSYSPAPSSEAQIAAPHSSRNHSVSLPFAWPHSVPRFIEATGTATMRNRCLG
jgi:hypothetical protein